MGERMANEDIETIIYRFVAGEPLRAGDYVKVNPTDGKVYRADPAARYDFQVKLDCRSGEVVTLEVAL